MSGLPNSLKRKRSPHKFNFSWMGDIASKIRRILNQETEEEVKRIERQSEIASQEASFHYNHHNQGAEHKHYDSSPEYASSSRVEEQHSVDPVEYGDTYNHAIRSEGEPDLLVGETDLIPSKKLCLSSEVNNSIEHIPPELSSPVSKRPGDNIPELEEADDCETEQVNTLNNKGTVFENRSTPGYEPENVEKIDVELHEERESSACKESEHHHSELNPKHLTETVDFLDDITCESVTFQEDKYNLHQEPVIGMSSEAPQCHNYSEVPLKQIGIKASISPSDVENFDSSDLFLGCSAEDSQHSYDIIDNLRTPEHTTTTASKDAKDAKKSNKIEFPYVGFLFGPQIVSDSTSDISYSSQSSLNNPPNDLSNDALDTKDGDQSEAGSHDAHKVESIQYERESCNDADYSAFWKRLSIGFTVAPTDSPSNNVLPREDINNQVFDDKYNDIDEEFSILVQSAHRLLSTSTLFGGTPTITKNMSESILDPVTKKEDPDLEYKKTTGKAQSLFAKSSLFGVFPQKNVKNEQHSAALQSEDHRILDVGTSNQVSNNFSSQSETVLHNASGLAVQTENSPSSEPIESEKSKSITNHTSPDNRVNTDKESIILNAVPQKGKRSRNTKSALARKSTSNCSTRNAIDADNSGPVSDDSKQDPPLRKRRLRKRQ